MIKYISILLFLLITAFTTRESNFSYPSSWPKPTYDFSKNPIEKNKVILGRVLFYDPILSENNSISCESCHSPYSAFTHIDHALSHGIYDSIGTRNSLALMNLAWKKTFMWDGAINNLDMQALAPISHPLEMGSSIKKVVIKLQASKKYRQLYFQAYGDSIPTGEKTLKAISQFLLTLVSANSKYDKVMSGDLQFTAQEKNGYTLFQKNCSSCHREPLFTNDEFANNGLPDNPTLKDKGRMHITLDSTDTYKFKIPTLRNIEYTFPYMHDGRFKKLSEVMNHYTSGIIQSKTLAPELKEKIKLTENEKVDLISFLLTLSDKEFVFNSNHTYPKEIISSTAKD
ncbi:MAG: c-type cytochrome [Bacteroidia bacterium]|nr:c-type cytochrome [Bacteroidia bacterium]MBP7244277.1 c-type cytochrome [Bacteroidia bacterium]